MSKLQIKANFKAAGAEKQVGETSVTKFYVDIDKDGEYPSVGEFQFWGDRIDINKFNEGDPVTVKFDIKGKKWTNSEGKTYFLQNLTAWSMVNGNSVLPEPPEPAQVTEDEVIDDLPW